MRRSLDCQLRRRRAGRGRAGAAPGDTGGREAYLVARAAHDGREDGAGRVIAREAGLDQPGAIVAHQGGGLLVVAHLGTVSAGSAGGGEGVARAQRLRGWPPPRPGRRRQSAGALGGTCHLSVPLGRQTEGVGGAAEIGGRSAERKGGNDQAP